MKLDNFLIKIHGCQKNAAYFWRCIKIKQNRKPVSVKFYSIQNYLDYEEEIKVFLGDEISHHQSFSKPMVERNT